jgi:hypothetical protein
MRHFESYLYALTTLTLLAVLALAGNGITIIDHAANSIALKTLDPAHLFDSNTAAVSC